MKILPAKINLTGTNHLKKPKQKNQIFNIASSQIQELGSSMIELLIATVLALAAASSSVQIINSLNTTGLNRRAAATSAIEVAISNDLAWFRQYAVLWRMQTGPFETLDTELIDRVTNLSSSTYSKRSPNSLSTYEQPPGCPSATTTTTTTAMAEQFQDDAANLYMYLPSNDQPPNPINAPPNTVPADDTLITIALPKSASGYTLNRKIQPNGSLLGVLTITYTLEQSSTKIFERSSSLLLPAAGWCP
jgi:hypothetical protein